MEDHKTNLFLETFKIIICAVELLLTSALLNNKQISIKHDLLPEQHHSAWYS